MALLRHNSGNSLVVQWSGFCAFIAKGLVRELGTQWAMWLPTLTAGPVLTQSCLFVTPWTVACQARLSMGILQARILKWVAIP